MNVAIEYRKLINLAKRSILIPKAVLQDCGIPAGYIGRGDGKYRSLRTIEKQCAIRERETIAKQSRHKADKLAKSARIAKYRDVVTSNGFLVCEFNNGMTVDMMLRQDAAHLEFAKLFGITVNADDENDDDTLDNG